MYRGVFPQVIKVLDLKQALGLYEEICDRSVTYLS